MATRHGAVHLVAIEGQSVAILDGGVLWAAHDELGWFKGRVLSKEKVVVDGQEGVEVEVLVRKYGSDGERGKRLGVALVDLLPISELDEDTELVGDVLNLQLLHDAAVFETLRLRYFEDKIYTQAGPTSLISINPYKQIVPLYTQRAIDVYSSNSDNAPPHVFGVAQAAFNNLCEHSVCQSILCSGESGAGKTEVAKLVVQFLAATTSKESGLSGGGAKVNPLHKTRQVQNQIIESNPLLESFGNAKTVRNENSSRFGKFIQILFGSDHTICGGRVRHYLLEKSRVVSQHRGERNYHVFYQMCAGLSAEARAQLSITKPQDYVYLSQSGVFELVDTEGKKLCDEVVEFGRLTQSMSHMRIEPEMQALVWQTIAAILHLGNIEFEVVDMKSEGEGSRVANRETLQIAAGLLDCEAETLEQGLTCISMKVTGEAKSIMVPQNRERSAEARDALAKVIYEKLFAWLVACVNACLQTSDLLSQLSDAERTRVEKRFIGVLDIFGFEVFENNSFEQLCINYANESLQQQFINQMLHSMMAQYKSEGVVVDSIPFEDNSPCVELLEGKLGVFALLDDECNFPKGCEEDFLSKLMDRCKGHSHLKAGGTSSDPFLKDGVITARTAGAARVQSSKQCFVVSHFAGEVEYNVTSFLEKNRDTINDSLRSVLRSSQQPLISILLNSDTAPGGGDAGEGEEKGGRMVGGRRVGGASRTGGASRGVVGARGAAATRAADKRSLGFQFKSQLGELVKLIESGRAHYVRCVKPNSVRKPHSFEAGNVLRQLRCSGVTETVRARKAGWPVSHGFVDFVTRYGEVYCMTSKSKKPDGALPILKYFLKDEDLWRVGTTKVFIRDRASSLLEERYKTYRLECKLRVQARAKAFLQRVRYLKMEGAAISVQKNYRMWAAVAQRRAKMGAIRTVERVARGAVARRRLQATRMGAQTLEAAGKRGVVRREFASRRTAMRALQGGVRRGEVRRKYAGFVTKVIEKEREEERKRKEEEERQRLVEEERLKAEAEARRRHEREEEGKLLLRQAGESVDKGSVAEARDLLNKAREMLEEGGAKKGEVDEIEANIVRASERLGAGEEANQLFGMGRQQVDKATTEAEEKEARRTLKDAKSRYEKALMAKESEKVSELLRMLDDKEEERRHVGEAVESAKSSRDALAKGDMAGARASLGRAEAALARAGKAEAGGVRSEVEMLRADVEEAERRRREEEERKWRMEKEAEAEQEEDSKRAEEQSKGMQKEDERREREAAQMKKERQKAEEAKKDTRMAVQVGGFVAGDDDSVNMSGLDVSILSPASQKAPQEGHVDAILVKLLPDPKLEVLKEGWLLKQSKKLKKWQKRYFVLDQVALYYCRNPTSVPDGFFAIRRCQFHYSEKTCCFDVITPSRVFRMQTPSVEQLNDWAACYKKAMGQRDFPYFHVEQTTRLDLSRELLLGVMSKGIRMVKLGLYDPGYEEEIAFFTFDDIYSWGASDLETFEFRVASERTPYVFKTMYASDIEQKLEARFNTWREWRVCQATNRGTPGTTPARATPQAIR